MSLLSVPTFVAKNIVGFFFIPINATSIDLDNEKRVLEFATREHDWFFYVKDKLNEISKIDKDLLGNLLRAIVRELAPVKTYIKHTDEKSKGGSDSEINFTTSVTTENIRIKINTVNDDSRVWHYQLGNSKSVKGTKSPVCYIKLPHIFCQSTGY